MSPTKRACIVVVSPSYHQVWLRHASARNLSHVTAVVDLAHTHNSSNMPPPHIHTMWLSSPELTNPNSRAVVDQGEEVSSSNEFLLDLSPDHSCTQEQSCSHEQSRSHEQSWQSPILWRMLNLAEGFLLIMLLLVAGKQQIYSLVFVTLHESVMYALFVNRYCNTYTILKKVKFYRHRENAHF